MPQFRYIPLCSPAPAGGCVEHGADCPTPGKRPLAADWSQHWSLERPEGNAGVLCGPESGLLVIDTDTDEALAQKAAWGLPETFTVKTGRGGPGYHFYYRWPAGLERVPNRLDGVEIKGPGRQVVAWGSRHKSGGHYELLGGQLAELPAEFVRRLRDATVQHSYDGVLDATPGAESRLERWLAEFPEAEQQHDGDWVMRCPAHDDTDPSLVVTASENRLLVHCRAGCPVEDVVDAVGWNLSDLWAKELPTKSLAELVKRPLGTKDDLGTRARLTELLGADLPPVAWAVPDLLPDGLTLLAGPPKLGKSWMVLDIAISVAAGRPVLGRATEPGDVLYLALEDNWRRLQGRARKLLGDTPAPAGLELWTKAGKLDNGLRPEIEAWMDSVERPRVVIIDTLGRVQGASAWADSKDGGYADAVEALAGLQELAAERHVALVVITHTKKGGWSAGADPLEAVLGSQGYAGTADAILVLKRERGQAEGELFVTGREIDEELTEAVWFDHESCRWIVGSEDYPTLADQILDYLEAKDKRGELANAWQTYAQIAAGLHRREVDVMAAVKELEAAGQVASKPRPGRGRPGLHWGPAPVLPPGLQMPA